MRQAISAKSNFVVAAFVAMLVMPPNAANAANAEREKILAAAKSEGRLVLYTGMDTEEANLYAKEFTKKYPFIKTEIFRSSGEKVQARFVVEQRAGTHLADIFQTSIVQVYQLKNANLLARYVPEEAAVYPGSVSESHGHSTALFPIPYVIGCNTR